MNSVINNLKEIYLFFQLVFNNAYNYPSFDSLDIFYTKNNSVVTNQIFIDRFYLSGEHYIPISVPTIELGSFVRLFIKKSVQDQRNLYETLFYLENK